MLSQRKHRWSSARRRLLASAALAAYLAAALGLPLPPPAIIKDGGKPFPCQGHECGCQTAEECWRHCCCYTAAERWAWAEANHVRPPDDHAAGACCREADGHADGCPHCHEKARPPLRGLFASPLSCRGQTTHWASAGVVPAPEAARPPAPESPAADRLPHADVAPRVVAQSPPFPPPRVPSSV